MFTVPIKHKYDETQTNVEHRCVCVRKTLPKPEETQIMVKWQEEEEEEETASKQKTRRGGEKQHKH